MKEGTLQTSASKSVEIVLPPLRILEKKKQMQISAGEKAYLPAKPRALSATWLRI